MLDQYKAERDKMVDRQIRSRGVSDPKVLKAMRTVPREEFVSASQRGYAYSDGPLPIGKSQTISQPYIVAYMTELLELEGPETVLELGTGCGYQTAVLAEIAAHVYTIEVIGALAQDAEERLINGMGYKNIIFKTGDGKEGWEEYTPFDRIIVTAAPAHFPKNLFAQLKEGGIAVAPVGDYFQRMIRYRKMKKKVEKEALIGVSFVPLV